MLKNSVDTLAARMHDIQSMKEEELKRLCEKPTNFAIAQALTDALMSDLNGLFNYDHVVDGNGKRYDTLDVIRELERDIKKTFLTLTGKEYVPTICRQIDYAHEHSPILAKLREWRKEHAAARNIPAYLVMPDYALRRLVRLGNLPAAAWAFIAGRRK